MRRVAEAGKSPFGWSLWRVQVEGWTDQNARRIAPRVGPNREQRRDKMRRCKRLGRHKISPAGVGSGDEQKGSAAGNEGARFIARDTLSRVTKWK
jgi:hypothetical protein